jgi:hypothetical protein
MQGTFVYCLFSNFGAFLFYKGFSTSIANLKGQQLQNYPKQISRIFTNNKPYPQTMQLSLAIVVVALAAFAAAKPITEPFAEQICTIVPE